MNSNIETVSLMARLLVVLAMYLVLRSVSRWMWLLVVLRLPSTIAHELSHFLLGVLCRAKPVGISFWPRRVAGTNQYVLGHVAFENLTFWKTLPVATAPLLILLPLGCWLIAMSLSRAYPQSITLLFCFGALQCFMGCWPSSQDWALARHALYVLLAFFLSAAVAYIWLYS